MEKVLLLLAAGFVLGFSGSPARYGRILKIVAAEWEAIERKKLYSAIRALYESKLIRYQECSDQTISIVLSREGNNVAMRCRLDELFISKPRRWDQKWRVVLFDVPEKQKNLRDALRMHFKRLGLIELQKSVFVHPYECRNEIDFIIEVYGARRFVRFIEATHIDNGLHYKKKFNLS